MRTASQKPQVKILVADNESFMREIIVNALSASGYREIRSVSKLAQLQEVMESNYPDLLIINGEMDDGDPVEFVRQVRLFRIGRNPFVPTVMTTWHSDVFFVRRVVDSGIDVLLTKPLAAGQLFSRIDHLIYARPPFVATATYLGPDRRKFQRGGEFPQFEAPNTLRERIDGKEIDPEDLGARISKTFAALRRQRKSMQEADIGRIFALVSRMAQDDGSPEDFKHAMGAMVECAELYVGEFSAILGKSAGFAKELVETLKHTASSARSLPNDDGSRITALLGELGIEIPADDDDEEEPADEFGQNDVYLQTGTAI